MMMKAIEISQTGGPEVMQMRDLAIPKPQHGEVLIQIAASGINFVDLFVREGAIAIKRLSRRVRKPLAQL
jgi:NADPH:quinone reductase